MKEIIKKFSMKESMQEFNQFFKDTEFIDRYEFNNSKAVDIIIPLINTNGFFEQNLKNYYKEIPIKRLLIGDGGCTDDSIETAKRFPRVKIIDCKKMVTQGYCIRQLINEVETKHFIYLHADAYLPSGWFDEISSKIISFDWIESKPIHALMALYIDKYEDEAERSFSGAQMGNSEILKKAVSELEDDYIQRNEDIIIRERVQQCGGRYTKNEEKRYYHQQILIYPSLQGVQLTKKTDEAWETKIYDWQIKGILKYTEPNKYLQRIVIASMLHLHKLEKLDYKELRKWMKKNASSWKSYFPNRPLFYGFLVLWHVKQFINQKVPG